jgi:NAD(P)-dependent dehydrogenase (short-subunit alcohol dehydrogenase family)
VVPEKLEAAKLKFAESGIHIHGYLLDVTDEEAVERTIPVIEKEVGPIDILVNNAGIIKRIPIPPRPNPSVWMDIPLMISLFTGPLPDVGVILKTWPGLPFSWLPGQPCFFSNATRECNTRNRK